MNKLSKDELVNSLIASMESINRQVDKERKERKIEKEKFLNNIKDLEKKIEELNLDIQNNENKYNKELNEEKQKYNELLEDLKIENEKLKEEIKQLNKEKEDLLEKTKKEKEDLIETSKKEKEELLKNIEQEKIKLEEEQKKSLENLKEEKLKMEQENKKQLELIQKKREEEEKKLKEDLEREKMKIKKEIDKEKLPTIDHETSKLLIDIVYNHIFKILNGQYYISIFDYIEQSAQNFELLDFFSQLNAFDNFSIDDNLFKFFNNFQSYINIKGDNSNLEDFLSQKSFKFFENKPNLELLKKISKLNIGNDKNMLEIYKEKRDNFMKSLSLSFDLLKSKFQKSMIYTNSSDKPNFLRIDKPNLKEITINMNEINIFKFYPLFKYQLVNIIYNIPSLTIITSSPHLIIIYDIILYCEKLTELNLICSFDENAEENSQNNISIVGETIPKIINSLKKLTSFSIQNIPLEGNVINSLRDALMYSNISSLGLSYTKIPQTKFDDFSQYFKNNKILTELDLSGYNFNILSTLNNSLFLSENNITSLTLSDNKFVDEDFQLITDILTKNPKIKKLNISKNTLTQKSCNILGVFLNKSTTIEDLNISSCGLTGENIALLVNSKGCLIFKTLILDNNNIGDIGLVMISNYIKNSTNLNTISLKNISGSDMGFNPIITNVLITKSPIKNIHFEKNKLITENLIKEIIKNSEKYDEKEIQFMISSTCVKDKSLSSYKCLKLIK